jgi:hypothetical protein
MDSADSKSATSRAFGLRDEIHNVMAPASSGEQSSRASDLAEEIEKKLTRAKTLCGAMMQVTDIDSVIADSLWAAEGLVADAEKAFKELRDIGLWEPNRVRAPEKPEALP